MAPPLTVMRTTTEGRMVAPMRIIPGMFVDFRSARAGAPGRTHSKHTRSLLSEAIMLGLVFVLMAFGAGSFGAFGQKRQKRTRPISQNDVSLTSHSRDSLTPEAREMVELA